MTKYSLTHVVVFFTRVPTSIVISTLELALGFSNGVILQREPKNTRLFGTALPNNEVKIFVLRNSAAHHYGSEYSQKSTVAVTCTANDEGQWLALLPPQVATPRGVSYTIVITSGTQVIKINDVLFGDVFLCAGQSNMVSGVLKYYRSLLHKERKQL